jgi:hypothetical protein
VSERSQNMNPLLPLHIEIFLETLQSRTPGKRGEQFVRGHSYLGPASFGAFY